MKLRLLICGNYGVENVGDEAILQALIQKFEGEYALTVMSANPPRTQEKLGVEAVRFLPTGLRSWAKALFTPEGRKTYRLTCEAIAKNNIFLLGGGTLLTDLPRRSLWIWGKHLEAAYRAGKRVWIYANGVGPFEKKTSERWARKLVTKAERVSVRDAQSEQRVREWGREDVKRIKDPVFEWNPLEGKEESPAKNAIVFSPRFWTKNEINTQNSLVELIRYICLEKGKKVIGIPFEKSCKKDIEFMSKIFEQAGVGGQARLWDAYADEVEVYHAIRSSKGVVGMRLHSLIFAAKAGVPFIGIAYMDKVAALGEELDQQKFILPLERLSGKELIKVFDQRFTPKAFERFPQTV